MAIANGPDDGGPAPTDLRLGRSVLILYGSETGNSQELAEDLDRSVRRLRFTSTVSEMNSVQVVRSPSQTHVNTSHMLLGVHATSLLRTL
jgi:sulfite reductase alpha subunit-like flavoprotein